MKSVAGALAIDETHIVRIPEIHYARSGDIAVAYQVAGEGRPDIVFVRAIAGDLLSTWEQPLLVRQLDVFASCGRLLMLDKRGTGLSDRVRQVQAVETAMDDIRAVMDAANSERDSRAARRVRHSWQSRLRRYRYRAGVDGRAYVDQ